MEQQNKEQELREKLSSLESPYCKDCKSDTKGNCWSKTEAMLCADEVELVLSTVSQLGYKSPEQLREQIADWIHEFANRTLKGEMVSSLEFADQLIKDCHIVQLADDQELPHPKILDYSQEYGLGYSDAILDMLTPANGTVWKKVIVEG